MRTTSGLARGIVGVGFFALGIGGMGGSALASSGCDAVNSGVFNWTYGGGGVYTYSNVSQSGFAEGDKITVNVATGDQLHYNILSSAMSLVTIFHPADGSVFSATLASGQTTLDLSIADHSSNPTAVTVTCVGAAVAEEKPNDSDVARSVQIAGSRLVARASATAIGLAASAAISSQFLTSSSPAVPVESGLGGASGLGGPGSGTRKALPGQIGQLGHGSDDSGAGQSGQWSNGTVHLWSAVQGSMISDDNSSADYDGNQVNLTSGVGVRVLPGLVIGALTSYENFDYDLRAINGNFSGKGYTGGAYLGAKLTQILSLDLLATYSRMDYDVVGGTASGSLDADRWLFSGGLSGRVPLQSNGLFAEPGVSVLWLSEQQEAWRDSLGTAQASRDFDDGRVSLGSKFGTSYVTSSATVTPYVGGYADYYFGSDTDVPIGLDGLGLNHDWSFRAVAGVSAAMTNDSTLSFGGSVGGIGDDYITYSLSAQYGFRF